MIYINIVFGTENGHDQASPTATSAAATTITKKTKICPSRALILASESNKGYIGGVEHQLKRHKHHNRVLSADHAKASQGKHDQPIMPGNS